MVDLLLHVYAKDGEPFRSLSALPDAEALALMRRYFRPDSIYWSRFEEPAGYLQVRRQVEAWLRSEFIAKGGRPQDAHPVYMVLGRTPWMESALNAATQATTCQIEVPLALFSPAEISFTYPDSMVSAMLAHEKDPAYYLPEYHGRLFTLPEMQAIVDQHGLPGETWGANLPSGWANYIEAQVWNRAPLLAYQQPASTGA